MHVGTNYKGKGSVRRVKNAEEGRGWCWGARGCCLGTKNWKTRQKGNHRYRSKTEFEVILKKTRKSSRHYILIYVKKALECIWMEFIAECTVQYMKRWRILYHYGAYRKKTLEMKSKKKALKSVAIPPPPPPPSALQFPEEVKHGGG
jgi:hypothetical protein